jgi:hypothetical protein
MQQTFTRKFKNRFTQIPNAILECKDLSAKAKGICCYLLSKPDGWIFKKGIILNELKEGRDAFDSAIAELLEIGFLSRVQLRGDKGQFIGTHYTIYDEPQEKQEEQSFEQSTEQPLDNDTDAENQATIKPYPENPYPPKRTLYISNTDNNNTKNNNTEIIKKINKKSPLADKEFLDTFYFYKMQIGALKQFPTEHKETQEMTKAYQSWNKVLKDYDAEHIQQSCKVYFEYIEITKLTWDSGGCYPRRDLTTWLNNFQSVDSWNGLKIQEMQKPKYKAMEDKRQDALYKKKIQELRQNDTEVDPRWDFKLI